MIKQAAGAEQQRTKKSSDCHRNTKQAQKPPRRLLLLLHACMKSISKCIIAEPLSLRALLWISKRSSASVTAAVRLLICEKGNTDTGA